MQTIQVEIPDRLAALFENACLERNEIKQDVMKELLIRYLEDLEDVAAAMQVIDQNEPTIPLEEIERKYGLEN